jgi:hypothetical protein
MVAQPSKHLEYARRCLDLADLSSNELERAELLQRAYTFARGDEQLQKSRLVIAESRELLARIEQAMLKVTAAIGSPSVSEGTSRDGSGADGSRPPQSTL